MMPPDNATSEVSLEDGTSDNNGPPALPHTGPVAGDNEMDPSGPGSTDGAEQVPRSGSERSISLHPMWLKTLSGQLVCMEVIYSLLGFICIVAGPRHPSYWLFGLVAFFSFGWTTFVLLVHLFQLYRMATVVPWMTIELIVYLVFVILWFVVDLVLLANLILANSGAAIMCGLFAFLTFCGHSYLGFTEYLDQVRKQGTPLPSAVKRADKAEGVAGGDGDDDSNSEDSLSEMPTVNPI